jgi:hypothetical protein
MIVCNIFSLRAVEGLVSRCRLSTVDALVCGAVPPNVSDEVAAYAFRGGVNDPRLVRGAPDAVGHLIYALEGVIPAVKGFEPSWIVSEPLEFGEPVSFCGPVDRM